MKGGGRTVPWKPEKLPPQLNCELETKRQFWPWPGKEAGARDENHPARSALGHRVMPQRREKALAYEKYIKQYNYLVLINIFSHHTNSIKRLGNRARRVTFKIQQ